MEKLAWELIEHRTQPEPERGSSRKQPRDRLIGVTEPFHVCQERTRFDSKDEVAGNLRAPRREHRAIWETIEGIVQLDGIEPEA